jgi:hypothetical protein
MNTIESKSHPPHLTSRETSRNGTDSNPRLIAVPPHSFEGKESTRELSGVTPKREDVSEGASLQPASFPGGSSAMT